MLNMLPLFHDGCGRHMTIELDTNVPATDLKTARENSGLTLKELFERTRISVVNLEAIENGAFHLLPVPLYARNFIKTYAAALGVDSGPVLARYEEYHRAVHAQEQAIVDVPKPGALAQIIGRHKTILWIGSIFIIFIAVSLLVSVTYRPAGDLSGKSPVKQEKTMVLPAESPVVQPDNLQAAGATEKLPEETRIQQAAEPVTTTSAAGKIENPAAMPADAGDGKEFLLAIEATEETWLRIQSDDKEPAEVLLKRGDKVSRKAERFRVDIGNAGGIRMSFDGKEIENLGKPGQVIHLRLP